MLLYYTTLQGATRTNRSYCKYSLKAVHRIPQRSEDSRKDTESSFFLKGSSAEQRRIHDDEPTVLTQQPPKFVGLPEGY